VWGWPGRCCSKRHPKKKIPLDDVGCEIRAFGAAHMLLLMLWSWRPAVPFLIASSPRCYRPRLQAPLDLPPDSLILQEADHDVWLDETLEYSGLRDDADTPHALRGYICSFRLPSGVGCHAFKGGGTQTLSQYLRACSEGGDTPTEAQRLRLVVDMLAAVNHLHCRGCAHLDLTAESFIIRKHVDVCAARLAARCPPPHAWPPLSRLRWPGWLGGLSPPAAHSPAARVGEAGSRSSAWAQRCGCRRRRVGRPTSCQRRWPPARPRPSREC
jgi:hypothetical protein